MGNTENTYQVFIKCFTFNHVNYIEDAMRGFVMQKTDFPYIAAIVDDASTDGEPEAIKRFLEKEFDMASAVQDETEDYVRMIAKHKTNVNCTFVVVFLKYNHYSIKKKKLPYFKEWYDNVKYIAMCEGDDYWADSLKLQKQVDYLEGHEECVMCAHAANWEMNGKIERSDTCHNEECDLTTDEVIREGGLYLATASLTFRRELSDLWPSWRKNANVGDYPLQILGTLQGKLHYFPDIMCVYRYQASGSWTAANLGRKDRNLDYFYVRTRWLLDLNEDTNHKFEKAICTALFNGGYGNLFASGRVGLRQYLYVMKNGYRTKKMNHFVKEMCSRYLGFSI